MALIASRLHGHFLVRTRSFCMDIGAVMSRQQVDEVAGVCGLACPDLESAQVRTNDFFIVPQLCRASTLVNVRRSEPF